MQRIVFVNLHGNEMLVKTMNKFVFKQSVAIKHKYLLDYLLSQNEIQVCTYINKIGFSMASSLPRPLMKFLSMFRFLEHKIVMRKNHIPHKSIKVIRNIKDIRNDDIVIAYRHSGSSLYGLGKTNAFKAISMIHFWGIKEESEYMKAIQPDILFNEADLTQYCTIFQKYYAWYNRKMIVHPFVFASRFKRNVPFSQRENKAFATGTITYRDYSEFIDTYNGTCVQPIRKQIKIHSNELDEYIYCTCSDYSENAKSVQVKHQNTLTRFYQALHYKLFESQQKSYYSFDMVQSFNKYKMCIVGEEVLGVPGIGFVEGMACGCAYIGQKVGYYEDYGMIDGVHYIGYDGTLEDLKAKIAYYQMPEHQDELEKIANAGYEFVQIHCSGENVAKSLLEKLIAAKKEQMK